MTAKQSQYQALSQELDKIVHALQQPDVAVDEAVALYEKGMKLVERLEKHVVQAETTLEKISLQFDAPKES